MHDLNKNLDLDFLLKACIIILLWATPPLVSKRWVGSTSAFPGFYFGFLRYFFGFFALLVIIGSQKRPGNMKDLIRTHFKPILFCAAWLVLMIPVGIEPPIKPTRPPVAIAFLSNSCLASSIASC